MHSFIHLLLLVVLIFPVSNSFASPLEDEMVKQEQVAEENANRNRKRVKRVIMSNKVIEYKKTFYIT